MEGVFACEHVSIFFRTFVEFLLNYLFADDGIDTNETYILHFPLQYHFETGVETDVKLDRENLYFILGLN